ncbi:MAG: bifunctional hydroxymethylpyrimidine kinase/phosphomethylpyrimidine kinase [bacterium]
MNNANSVVLPSECPVVLTIAGSDSGGGAGIQADLKTFSALGVFGASAITCLTAQSPKGVLAVHAVDAKFVAQQIRAVCEAFPISVAKTGMLYSADVIRAVAAEDIREGISVLVVDPVMVSAFGEKLLKDDAIAVLCSDLLQHARVVTPNLHEAEILCGHAIASMDELRAAAQEIGDKFDVACVVKGGHLEGDEVYDILYDEGEEFVFSGPRVPAMQTHGAGCAFSAALAAYLAQGKLLSEAVSLAKIYVRRALETAVVAGPHRPLNFQWNAPFAVPV